MSTPAYKVTEEGYAVEKINGNYKYLEMDEADGDDDLVESGLMCGKDDPNTSVGRSGTKFIKGLKGRAGHSTGKTV